MYRYWMLLLCCGLSLMVRSTEGYSYFQRMDTSRGFCDTGSSRIPVGTATYNNVICERITCNHGMLSTDGCGAVRERPGCQIVTPLGGQYPSCCPHMICGQSDTDNSL